MADKNFIGSLIEKYVAKPLGKTVGIVKEDSNGTKKAIVKPKPKMGGSGKGQKAVVKDSNGTKAIVSKFGPSESVRAAKAAKQAQWIKDNQ